MIVRIRIPRKQQSLAAVPSRKLGASATVAAGILISRISGLLRESLTGHFFGVNTVAADAFRGAIRIPTLLNNLFGEGVLSAAFITVYSKLRARGEDDDAERLAETVFGVLSAVCAVLVFAGILLAPVLTHIIVPGFSKERHDLTVQIVRILFPGTGLVVLSAWCLGVLNSHRQFLLSYVAPVAMNATMIAALLLFGRGMAQNRLVLYLAGGYLVGGGMQFLVQLPRVLQLLPSFRPAFDLYSDAMRTVIGNFGPVFLSRGAVQISSTVDSMIASWLPAGSVAAFGYAQVIAVLPISLFSMSVAAAELPALSSATGTTEEVAAVLRKRLIAGLRRIAFFVVPSAVAFLALGDIVAGAIFQSGRFTRTGTVEVWAILGGSAVGLLASALGRLYSSAFYALLDTRTPLRFALIRIGLTIVLGYLCALPLPRALGIDPRWGTAALTASAGVAGWLEFTLLRRSLNQRIGNTGVPIFDAVQLWLAAFAAAVPAYGCKLLMGTTHPRLLAMVALPLYGFGYFGLTYLLNVEESRSTIAGIIRRVRP